VTHGPFFSSTYLGNILAVSNLEARPVARLYALWYEHNAPDDRWSVRTGLMLADSQFLQSDTAANFINNRISWPTFLTGNLPASGPAYPLPAPGIRVRVKPRDDVAFQAAVFSGDPSGGDGSNLSAPLPTGTIFSFRGGAFVIAEASYLTNQGKDAKGLPGAYRIGAWYHTRSRFFDQRFDDTGLSLANPLSTGIPLRHTGDGGVYGVIDQTFYRVPGTDDQGLSGFVRAGGVPNDRNLISFYADGGLLYKGLPSRPDDKVGIAFAYARIGDNARGLDADTGFFGNFFFPVRSDETMIEMMYQAQLRQWWTLQPELQYIIRPGGGVLNPERQAPTERVGHRPSLDAEFLGPCRSGSREVRFGSKPVSLRLRRTIPLRPRKETVCIDDRRNPVRWHIERMRESGPISFHQFPVISATVDHSYFLHTTQSNTPSLGRDCQRPATSPACMSYCEM
jgi:porin